MRFRIIICALYDLVLLKLPVLDFEIGVESLNGISFKNKIVLVRNDVLSNRQNWQKQH